MAPDTGPNENSNKNDDYLSKGPQYNIEDDFSDDDSDYDNGIDEGIDDGDNNPGYQLLDQEGVEDSVDDHIHHHARGEEEEEDDDVDDNISGHVNGNNTISPNLVNPIASSFPRSLINSLPPPPVDQSISKQLESIARPDIELDDSKIDQIKRVMSGFSLPSSSIPGWASVVTEDQLTNFVHRKTT